MASSLSPMLPCSSWPLFFSFLLVFHCSVIPLCHSQSTSPQNIETFYPTPTPAPPQEPQSPPTRATGSSSSSSNRKIATAVAVTAAATFVVCGLIFFIVHRCLKRKRKQEAVVVPQDQIINGFERVGENVRGLIVDEHGLDVVYWRKLRGRSLKRDFQKEIWNKEQQEKTETVQESPLLRGKSSTSHIPPQEDDDDYSNRIIAARNSSLFPTSAIPKRNSSAPPTSPPLQSVQARKNSPPTRSRHRPPSAAMKSSSRPPPPASRKTPTNIVEPGNSSVVGMSESGNGQVKLKPLHWERMNSNGDHSEVRDKDDAGSFSVDQDLMEALFGYVAISRRSPKGGRTDSSSQSKGLSSQGQLRL